MEYIAFGGIYGNFEALKAFQKITSNYEPNKILFTGDFAGYCNNQISVLILSKNGAFNVLQEMLILLLLIYLLIVTVVIIKKHIATMSLTYGCHIV